MIHLYCGNGKGKTTAATGLIVRMLANKRKVLLISFLKDGTSSELAYLKKDNHITIKNPLMLKRFYSMMNEEEKKETLSQHLALINELKEEIINYDCIVLDEVIDAQNMGLVSLDDLISLIKLKPKDSELILTGRNPNEKIVELVDYYTEFKLIKHPYQKGIHARRGVEF